MTRTSPQDRPKSQKIYLEDLTTAQLITLISACGKEINPHYMLLSAFIKEFYERTLIS